MELAWKNLYIFSCANSCHARFISLVFYWKYSSHNKALTCGKHYYFKASARGNCILFNSSTTRLAIFRAPAGEK